MNLAGWSIALGLLVLAVSTMPYGLAILAGMIWLYSRG